MEYDGVQHFVPMEAWGGEDAFETQCAKDSRDMLLAEKLGYVLIRFTFNDFDHKSDIDVVRFLVYEKINKKMGKI